ncbi:MAG: hypothetical protein V3U54_08600 [Thermodesulfobacteriota bacterium]
MKTSEVIKHLKRVYAKKDNLFEQDLDYLIRKVRKETKYKAQQKCEQLCRPKTPYEMLAEEQQDFTGIV